MASDEPEHPDTPKFGDARSDASMSPRGMLPEPEEEEERNISDGQPGSSSAAPADGAQQSAPSEASRKAPQSASIPESQQYVPPQPSSDSQRYGVATTPPESQRQMHPPPRTPASHQSPLAPHDSQLYKQAVSPAVTDSHWYASPDIPRYQAAVSQGSPGNSVDMTTTASTSMVTYFVNPVYTHSSSVPAELYSITPPGVGIQSFDMSEYSKLRPGIKQGNLISSHESSGEDSALWTTRTAPGAIPAPSAPFMLRPAMSPTAAPAVIPVYPSQTATTPYAYTTASPFSLSASPASDAGSFGSSPYGKQVSPLSPGPSADSYSSKGSSGGSPSKPAPRAIPPASSARLQSTESSTHSSITDELQNFQPLPEDIYCNNQRRIFGSLPLLESEERALLEFEPVLLQAEVATQDTIFMDDMQILRFLQANGFNFQNTIEAMLRHLDWTQDLPGFGPDCASSFVASGSFQIAGRDRKMRPLFFVRMRSISRDLLVPEMIIPAVAYCLEFMKTNLFVLNKVEQWRVIIDFDGFQHYDVFKRAKSGLKEVQDVLQAHYPGYLRQMFFLNLDSSFRDAAIDNVTYIRYANDFIYDLQRVIPADQLSQQYGGARRTTTHGLAVLFPVGDIDPTAEIHPVSSHLLSSSVRRFTPSPAVVKELRGSVQERKIFGNLPLDTFEEAALDNFLAFLDEKGFIRENTVFEDVHYVLRFLQGQQRNYSKVLDRMTKHLEWRRVCLPVMWYQVRTLVTSGFAYICGRDRDMRPVIIVQVEAMNRLTLDQSKAVLVYWLEFSISYLMMKNAIEQWTVILDAAGSSFWTTITTSMAEIVEFFQTHYPGRLHRLFVLNEGMSIKMKLASVPQEKICMLGTNYAATLLNAISSRQLERKFGGKVRDVREFCFPTLPPLSKET